MSEEYLSDAEGLAYDIYEHGWDGQGGPGVQDVAACYIALQFERIADALENQE
ncbi:hypothetical protein LC1Hm_2071 [Halomicrobium sp. LC1Hm]|nr:hypothetical protein LC1Hm_2071 [Halomicrobium sp. LC1Hm]